MKKYGILFGLLSVLFLAGCSALNCDPRYNHCGGSNPQMQDEIADEVGQML